MKFDISPPLRDMKPLPWKECTKSRERRGGPIPLGTCRSCRARYGCAAGAWQNWNTGADHQFRWEQQSLRLSPPDPNGAVGPNHVVTMANLHFQIFNKTGTIALRSGGEQHAVVWIWWRLPDPKRRRSRCALRSTRRSLAPFAVHFVSGHFLRVRGGFTDQRSDWILLPLGYCDRQGNNFPDYPKAGMWPDAYYFSTREFAGGRHSVGVGAYALDRAQALAGNPNPTIVGFLAPPTPPYMVGDGLLPSDLDGQTTAAAGSPNYFVGSQDNNGSYGAPSGCVEHL